MELELQVCRKIVGHLKQHPQASNTEMWDPRRKAVREVGHDRGPRSSLQEGLQLSQAQQGQPESMELRGPGHGSSG